VICRACGGGSAHHAVAVEEDENGCWCGACRELPPDQRCRSWDPVAPAQRFARSAKKATRARSEISLPREGSFKRQVYDFLASAALTGLTRSELEYKTAKTGDAVASAVISLRSDNLIEHTGAKRASDLTGSEEPAWRVRNS
jgi:hypothetical protein